MSWAADDVIEKAVQEMGERLEDEERRREIPDHVLVKFVAEANKTYERRAAEKKSETVVSMDVLEIVRTSDLPEAKKEQLIRSEIKRLDKRRRELEQELG